MSLLKYLSFRFGRYFLMSHLIEDGAYYSIVVYIRETYHDDANTYRVQVDYKEHKEASEDFQEIDHYVKERRYIDRYKGELYA